MQGAAAVERDKIGDIDEGRDRPKADGAQLFLQPRRTWSVLDVVHDAPGEERTGIFAAARQLQINFLGARESAGDDRNGAFFQTAHASGSQIARDTVSACAIARGWGQGKS